MALAFPYTYISCPCSDNSRQGQRSSGSISNNNTSSRDIKLIQEGAEADTNTATNEDEEEGPESGFDPRHPRSAFSLYPPEHLLYCEECHDIKCPRCVKEEILCWYCPYCLFETPSSTVRTETNRCARNCFNCPVCMSQLVTAPVGGGVSSSSGSGGDKSNKDGPFILNCNYCMWSTLDIGITFAQPTSIRAQLDKLANGGKAKQQQPGKPSRADSIAGAGTSDLSRTVTATSSTSTSSSLVKEESPSDALSEDSATATAASQPQPAMDTASRFAALRSFYKEQITSTSSTDSGLLPTTGLDLYSSPSSLARIMNLYSSSSGGTGAGGGAGGGVMGGIGLTKKNSRVKPTVMREAQTRSEGLDVHLDLSQPEEEEEKKKKKKKKRGDKGEEYIDSPSLSQLQAQHPPSLGNPTARSVSDLRPLPALLRTKRSKRCATCSHILVRPEFKPTSTRYRIKLLALNYIPFVTLRPMQPQPSLQLQPPLPWQSQSLSQQQSIDGQDIVLEPGKPSQWILTMRNPLYENVNVTLAAEALTPGGDKRQKGRARHRVTILCPEFEVGKSGDVWDDALSLNLGRKAGSDSVMAKRGGAGGSGSGGGAVAGGEGIAGKIYDRGRNWVSVILEIVPGIAENGDGDGDEDEGEDKDVIEVPIRVRLEWRHTDGDDGGPFATTVKKTTTTTTKKSSSSSNKTKSARLLDEGEGDDEDEVNIKDDGRREVAYWMVLGVGRVGRVSK